MALTEEQLEAHREAVAEQAAMPETIKNDRDLVRNRPAADLREGLELVESLAEPARPSVAVVLQVGNPKPAGW